jgi:hypothetical protein
VLLDRQDKHRTAVNEAFDELARDDRITIEGAEEKSGGLRLVEGSRVTRLQTSIGP